jgi:class 3 adenylate cyclase
MPLYMDLHKLQGVTPEALANAHLKDLDVQDKYGVRYLRYWFNEPAGKIFCLAEAPSADIAIAVHREAHGLLPDEIIEVESKDIQGFLGTTEEVPRGQMPPPDTAFRAVLFTDIEGSTALTQRLGDQRAMEFLRLHDSTVRSALSDTSGTEVKHTGDGIMASFGSVVRAVECAIRVQQALSAEDSVRLRVGISAGEPVEESNDLFGAAVQLAARACSKALAGQIIVSGVVRDLCIGKGFDFAGRGRARLKGFDEPVRLYEVRWRGDENG